MNMASMPVISITTELSPSTPYQALLSRVPSVKNPNRSVAPVKTKYAMNASWIKRNINPFAHCL